MNDYQRIRLPNGIRLVLAPIPHAPSVSVVVNLKVGSRHETEAMHGSAHFLEHMSFKGTKRRPGNTEIMCELNAVGAQYNATTFHDKTSYYIRLLPKDLRLAVDMLEDIVFNSRFSAQDRKQEAEIIVEEIEAYSANTMAHINNVLYQQLFSGHPLERPVIGTPESVRDIKATDLRRFRNRYYRPSRTVVVIAGQFDPKVAERLVRDKFSDKRAPRLADRRFKKYNPLDRPTEPQCCLVKNDLRQSSLVLGVLGLPLGHPQAAALSVASNILGGTMSSRLWNSLRLQYGLAYGVSTALTSFEDTGTFSVQTSMAPEKVLDGLSVIMSELKRLRDRPVPSAELLRSQGNIQGQITMEQENSMSLASWYGCFELTTRRLETPEKWVAKILSVTSEDVQRVMELLLNERRVALVAAGPFQEKQPFLDRLSDI